MPQTVLSLTNISKRYPGVLALDDVSLDCVAGEVHAILGENGSGKSTLLGIASGSVTPTNGRVEIMGTPLGSADPLQARRLGLATVYQDDSLVRELSVADNLMLAAGSDVPMRRSRAVAEAALQQYELEISPDALVGALTPAERQFLEIVKALQSAPKVLLLDEPTSTLDLAGVDKLSAIIRQLTAHGTAVVYVTHRLPEILALADRVSILRDGRPQGTHDVTAGLSETALIALMIGRSAESEYPPKRADAADGAPALSVHELSGRHFADVSLSVGSGEIVGFAGAEGNGQREALRAIAGFEPGTGSISCGGRAIAPGHPRDAIAAGVLMISADRHQESIFPALGVRENITVQVLQRFSRAGFVSGREERATAHQLAAELGIVAASIDQTIEGLSGGNQQKGVLARSFAFGARAILVDEPTQGVDANARFDIYRAMRACADAGAGLIVKSGDAMELAGICDRVIVFSRSTAIAELRGDEVSEVNIVSSFLQSSNVREARAPAAVDARRRFAAFGGDGVRPLLLLVALIVAVGAYAAAQSDVFLGPLNLRHLLLATAPLALVTMAQLNALLVGGFDVSVGSTMSLTVVLGSFLIGSGLEPALIPLGVLGCVAAGAAVGLINGVVVRRLGINPVIATIAMLSVLQGIALYLRPTPAGSIDAGFVSLLQTRIGFLPVSILVLAGAALAADWWLYRTRGGLRLRATGFRERAARRNGVNVDWVHIRAYLLSGLVAALAGLLLASEVGVGHPTIGANNTLISIAAAVIGGASLGGGRGSFMGAVLGGLFFTLAINIIPLLGLSAATGAIATGVLTLLAVLIYSGTQPLIELWRRWRPAAARAAASPP